MEKGIPCVKLPKAGKIPFAMPKGFTLETLIPQNSAIKKATITKQTDDIYEVSLLIETIVDIATCVEELHIKDIVSIDLGLSFFGIIGNYEHYEKIENPHGLYCTKRGSEDYSNPCPENSMTEKRIPVPKTGKRHAKR